ncbi:hypothetical protein BBP40_004237 [Aspergillus hancockii]|nr:hypothetical protein BBP40_004237 [Aspergillus hancockii]
MAPYTTPRFSKRTIQDSRKDGYWIGSFQFGGKDTIPGVIVSGLNTGKVEYLENPINRQQGAGETESSWTAYPVANLKTPVAVVAMDITQNGLMDVIVCHDFGDTMIECDMKGGHITWFENPGDGLDPNKTWTPHYIGRWPAMHRLQAGYFTQRAFPELIAAPVIHGRKDKVAKTTPVPIIIFQAPEKPLQASEWRRDIVDDQHFTVIHEIVAKREGVSWLYYDEGQWKRELIGSGEQKLPGQQDGSISPGSGDHWGTGSADIGKIGGDSFAYVATIDPFHSTKVCVYTKDSHPIYGRKWKRHILDEYGTPTQLKHWGDGPGHYVTCADIDGDGNDEFLVSMFGPLDRDDDGKPIGPAEQSGRNPNKGIYCYKPVDLEKGIFAKWQIVQESSGRCAVGNFCGNSKSDIASISYNVKDYYQEARPEVTLYRNEANQRHRSDARIVGTVWGNEGMVYIPDPTKIGEEPVTRDLIEVAKFRIRVEVYPPRGKIPVKEEEGIKPLYGVLCDTDGEVKPLGGRPFPARESLTTSSDHLSVNTTIGAVILRLTPLAHGSDDWTKVDDVPVKNIFDLSDVGLETPDMNFVRVRDTWWGGDFKTEYFFNLTGFHFRFQGNKQNIAHMQFWIAGENVDCRLHDHSDKSFKELHTCLYQGSARHKDPCRGGMWAPSKHDYYKPLDDIKRIRDQCKGNPGDCQGKCLVNYMTHCGLAPLEEHGRIWHTDHYGQTIYRKNNTVSYPGHTWIAGPGPNLDVWMALEFDAKLEL